MIIIYHCFGGSHSSVLAAGVHLGLIPKHRLPSVEEMMALPYFDKTCDEDFGTIRFMGFDDLGNQVYVLGKKSLGDRLSNILMGIAKLLDTEEQLITVNCMSRVNWSMKLGGFVSRRIGLVSLGRPVVEKGSQKAFYQLVNLVEITRLRALKATGV
ncbi:MAG: DUF3189 family protein [Syntrophomonadaceae bacterium]|nr:DUF3189 family protein [Syntrophomonadaceae bacterium]